MVSLRAVAVNTILGLIALVVANLVGLGVQISPAALLVCAIFGVFGAVLVIVLAAYGVAFAAVVLPPL